MKTPTHLPYLRNSWDRMDEYHTLDSEVTEDQVIEWFAVLFKTFNVKELKDVLNIQQYQLLNLAGKNSGGFYGTFEVDFLGGMFHTMSMYQQNFYHPMFPKCFQSYASSKKKNNEMLKERFEWIMNKVNEKYIY